MLELEKKHWTEYRKAKKEIKMYDNITKENKNKFYKVFNCIKREYYYNLKKEFLDSEIIEQCNVSEEILDDIKAFLKNKNLIQSFKNKFTICYETVVYLEELLVHYKKNNGVNAAFILLIILALILIFIGNFILKNLKTLMIAISIIIIICIIGYIIHKVVEKRKREGK